MLLGYRWLMVVGCFVFIQGELLWRSGGGELWVRKQERGEVVLRLGRCGVESGGSGLFVSGFGS